MSDEFKKAEDWLNEGWSSIPVDVRLDYIRKIQANAIRHAAKVVASGKSYRLDADPLYEASFELSEITKAIENGKYEPNS